MSTNDITASTITGVLQTGNQSNITNVGTLSSLTVSGTSTLDSLVSNALTQSVGINAVPDNTYKLKVEADKIELANLKHIAEKNKQKYNEEHNRISALSNTAVVSEFTDIFK